MPDARRCEQSEPKESDISIGWSRTPHPAPTKGLYKMGWSKVTGSEEAKRGCACHVSGASNTTGCSASHRQFQRLLAFKCEE